MKTNLRHILFIWLTLAAVISPATIYSAPKNMPDSPPLSNNAINKHKTSGNTHKQTTLSTTSNHSEKKILIDNSRGLSAFFILGIVINIIMIITFGWWFSKEWRRSKK